MKKNLKTLTALLLAVLMLAAALSGCGSKETNQTAPAGSETETTAESDGDVRVLQVRFDIAAAPMSYVDENGNATSKDDVLAGITAGTYDIGLHNAFYTTDRAEKFYIPTEPLGGSLAGLVMRKDVAAQFEGLTGDDLLEAIYDAGLKLTPLIAGDGRTYQFEQYNESHPDKAFEIEYTSDLNISTKYYEWIDEGRYDVGIQMKSGWDKNVVPEDGANHEYYDKIGFVTFKAIKTYPMISKINLDEAFLEELNAALVEAKQDPRVPELAEQFYGENIFVTYPYEPGW